MNDPGTTASPVGSDLPAGTPVGNYRIERLLGRGASGEVYAARDTRDGRQVALKILTPGLVRSPSERQRLYAEGWLAASLDHPNLPAIFEIGEADGRAFVAMEYVTGVTLDLYARQDRFDPRRALRIAIQLARAVREAHAHDVVHRDLTSTNILVSSDDRVTVLDFGLAFRAGAAAAGGAMGTADYASPEQILGRDVDARTDLFSLGVVLHEMLTGRLPFSGENRTELFRAIVNNPAMPVDRVNDAVPVALSNVVGRLLAKDREQRYQTADEVLADLEAIDTTGRPRPAARPRLVDRRWFKRVAGSAAGLILAVGGLFPASVVLSHETEAAIRSTAARQSGVWLGLAAGRVFDAVVTAAEMPDSVWVGNDGRLVYATSGQSGRTAIWTLGAGGVAPDLVTVHGRQPAVTSTGGTIVFAGASGDGLFRLDARGSGMTRLAWGPVETPRLTPDDRAVVFRRGRSGGVWSVPVDGGSEPRELVAAAVSSPAFVAADGRRLAFERGGRTIVCDLPGCVNARHFPIRNVKAWTPDGQGLAYVGQPRSANVWIAPIDGTTSRQITWFSGRAISSVAWSSDGRRLAVTRVMTLADLELLAAFR